jgi:uncharacterized OB-fold protein
MSLQREDFPLPDTRWEPTREYWQAAAREELRIPRCTNCARWVWYPKPNCPACTQAEFTWTMLSGRAHLFSHVVVRHAFLPQYQTLTPFVPALVVPVEAPEVRIATRIVEIEPEKIHIDMPLQVVFAPLQFAGVEATVVAPLFRPAP